MWMSMRLASTLDHEQDCSETFAGARGTSCPAKRSAGADALVDTLVLPPASLASSPSPALDTCASQAACTRQRVHMWRANAAIVQFMFHLACRLLNCTRRYNDQTPN